MGRLPQFLKKIETIARNERIFFFDAGKKEQLPFVGDIMSFTPHLLELLIGGRLDFERKSHQNAEWNGLAL